MGQCRNSRNMICGGHKQTIWRQHDKVKYEGLALHNTARLQQKAPCGLWSNLRFVSEGCGCLFFLSGPLQRCCRLCLPAPLETILLRIVRMWWLPPMCWSFRVVVPMGMFSYRRSHDSPGFLCPVLVLDAVLGDSYFPASFRRLLLIFAWLSRSLEHSRGAPSCSWFQSFRWAPFRHGVCVGCVACRFQFLGLRFPECLLWLPVLRFDQFCGCNAYGGVFDLLAL